MTHLSAMEELDENTARQRITKLLGELFSGKEELAFTKWYSRQTEHYRNIVVLRMTGLVMDPLMRKGSPLHRTARHDMLHKNCPKALFEYLKSRARNKKLSGNEPVGFEGNESENVPDDPSQSSKESPDPAVFEFNKRSKYQLLRTDFERLTLCVDGKIQRSPEDTKKRVLDDVFNVLRQIEKVEEFIKTSSGELNIARIRDL
ncbi:MAG: hypothetical protein ACNA8W_24920, partial [Bradymonadaceae bacterium]